MEDRLEKPRRNFTPELSDEASCTLRRIAWAVNKPMTTTLNLIFSDLLLPLINREWVCERCRDPTKCAACGFHPKPIQEDTPCS